MSYSLDKIPNRPYEIPPPPPYAVWVQETTWDYHTRTRTAVPGKGQVRHMADLAKAKSRVSRYSTAYEPTGRKSSDKFDSDWTIYLWNTEKNEYDVLYEGFAGETKSLNPLFKTKLKKGEKPEPRPGLDDEVDLALRSIAEAVR